MRLSIADGNCGKNVAEPRPWPLSLPRADPVAGPMELRVPEFS
jgi:hypothetical protein